MRLSSGAQSTLGKLTSTVLVLSTSTTTDDESRHPEICGLLKKPPAPAPPPGPTVPPRAVVLRGAVVAPGVEGRSVNDSDPPFSGSASGRHARKRGGSPNCCTSRVMSSTLGDAVDYGAGVVLQASVHLVLNRRDRITQVATLWCSHVML